jgi:signal transduction histidine kinase
MNDSIRTQQHLQRISESAARMMENMGDIVWSISPENDTLEKMLIKMKEFAAEILEPKNICYSFEEEQDLSKIKLSVETRKNLYLIFKESVNNAAKYSGGSSVVISLRLHNNLLHLSIRDNGKGFEATTVRYGNGLLNMSERARSVKGRLVRQSAPGKGTEIVAELPIT